MNDIIRATVAMVLNIALPLGLQVWDKRRHGATFRSQWSTATWGASLYAFGALSMLGWMWVTRPRWWRVLWGWLSCLCLNVAVGLVDWMLQLLQGTTSAEENNLNALVLVAVIMSLTLVMELCVTILGRMGVGRWAS